ncbi:protein CURVATURE THYLAKOID 1A [Chloropicon roscoffensis]|uniref:Protein CURVATURE THYLAKOID 1A n=1 Tax=Chloropicon roscoffensis TaxID=1461544 RepID=A0AAX4P121_9CHLO|mmetsp:Transcript_5764/g.17362  ORF Transcript_5764/g.17362 Transcript_5764/m.17362 type:complete len:155 (-) Transcript_5764:293-757(-)
MATSMKIVSNKAIASAAVSSRRTGLAKRSGAISARSNVSGLRKLNKEPARSTSFIARSGIDGDEILATVTEKWESVEDKPQAILYAGGAVVAVVLVNSVVGAVNSLPLLPKVFELVGLGYSAWFTYKYLLFKSSRAELAADIEELKAKIAGGSE